MITTFSPAPKPAPTEKRPRKPPQRTTWLARSETPIRKENPERKARVKKIRTKQRRSSDEKHARAEARIRANGQCEYLERLGTYSAPSMLVRAITIEGKPGIYLRCETTDGLQDHHKSHPKGRKITANHFAVLCTPHHHFTEATAFGYRHTAKRGRVKS